MNLPLPLALQITIQNRIPATFPRTSSGISIHFHGMSMWDEAAWADGTSFVTQCPIGTGTTYTYSFLVRPQHIERTLQKPAQLRQ